MTEKEKRQQAFIEAEKMISDLALIWADSTIEELMKRGYKIINPEGIELELPEDR